MSQNILKSIFLALILVCANNSKACTPYGVPTISANVVGSDIILNVTTTTTWNCGYVYEVEIICASGAYTGVPTIPAPATPGVTAGAYPALAIPIGAYCPGDYKLRVREKVTNYGAFGPWSPYSADFLFTIPGASLTVTASASPTSICFPGNSTLTATPSNACGSINYTWDNGGGAGASVVVSPVATTTYTVTATDAASCMTVTDQITITAALAVVPGTASLLPLSICEGETTSLSIVGETGTYQWQSGPTAAGPFTDIAGATTSPYVVGPILAGDDLFFQAVVTSCGIDTTNIINVTVSPAPPILAGTDQTVCDDGATVTLSGGGGVSYVWTGGVTDGIAFAPSMGTTTYTVTGTDVNGCINTDDVDVTLNALPVIDAGVGQSVCDDGSTVTLNGAGGVSYLWSGGLTDGLAFVPPAGTTTYTVTGTDANGCVNTDDVDVTLNALPVISAGVNQAVCNGDLVTLSGGGGVSYVWTGGVTDGTPFAAIPGISTYTVTGTDGNGCENTDDVDVSAGEPIIDPMLDFDVCEGDNLNIPGFTADIIGTTFTWTNLTGTDIGFGLSGLNNIPSFIATNSTGSDEIVTIEVTPILSSCQGVPITFQVSSHPLPQVQFTASAFTGCEPEVITFTNQSTLTGTGSCVWDFGNNATSTVCAGPATIYDAGVYTVSLTVTSSFGCSTSDTYTNYIDITQLPVASFSFSPQELDVQQSTEVEFTNTSINATNYEWNFGDQSPTSTVF